MINEKRVGHMTHMAVFEKSEEKDLDIASKYKREDYIRARILTGTLAGAAYYLLMYIAAVLLVCATFVSRIDSKTVVIIIVCGIAWLVIRIYFHIRHIAQIAGDHYDECEGKLEEFSARMRILNMMYDDEQARTTSWSGELQ